MNIFLILPILVPFLTAIIAIFAWNRRQVQQSMAVIGGILMVASGAGLLNQVRTHGIIAAQMGNWDAPFGITIVADLFSAIMVLLVAVVGLAVALYSITSIDEGRVQYGYFPLLFVLLMGITGSMLTGDMFNLYVWFEIMLISSFVLLAVGGKRAETEAAIKYVTLNLLASMLFLTALGILYGLAGTLNMADLAIALKEHPNPSLVTVVSLLFLLAFGSKAALFPFYFWLPASYHTPPAAISAVFAGLLTKVGVYTLVRSFTLIFLQDVPFTHSIILTLATLTMVIGILGAVAHKGIRQILSYNLISHVGYILMGLGFFTPLALAGTIFYTMHDIIVKTTLFLVSGIVNRTAGSYKLNELGGLYRSRPVLGILFMIPALALSGIPPLSGFWPKVALLSAGLQTEHYIVVAAALLASLLTLYTMMRIWAQAFWKDKPDNAPPTPAALDSTEQFFYYVPVISLVVMIVLMGLFAQPVFELTQAAANQLMNPTEYINAVLGG